MEKRSTRVRISGREYTLTGYETEEYMQKVASYVDKKMNEIRQKCFNLDSSMIAVLTAVNIADENLKLYERIEDLESDLSSLKEQQMKLELDTNTKHKKR